MDLPDITSTCTMHLNTKTEPAADAGMFAEMCMLSIHSACSNFKSYSMTARAILGYTKGGTAFWILLGFLHCFIVMFP